MNIFTRRTIVTAFILGFLIQQVTAQVQTIKYVSMGQNTNAYYEYLPQGYDPAGTQTYPVIIYVHGLGDLGTGTPTSMPLILRAGLPKLISDGLFPNSFTVNSQVFKFIVISPQYIYWPAPPDVNDVINYVIGHYKVTTSRIYLTGLSMGGGTTWEYAGNQSAYANRLAAIVPICGLSTPDITRARTISASNLPVWATHNDQDPAVPVSYTNDYVSEINAPPSPTPLAIKTIFHNNVHDAWTATYTPTFKVNNMNIYEWMLQYTRTATAINQAPIATAGPNQTILLPTSSVNLTGSGFDPDGTITSYAWSQVSGTAAAIGSPSSAATAITGLTTTGVRVFRLTVMDNSGAVGTSDVTITVNDVASNQPPTVNAGTDQSISLPTSSVTLSGSASDVDGNVASHTWTLLTGPTTVAITTPSSYSTGVTGLNIAGTYTFRLSATDNNNATGTDDVIVIVSPLTGGNKVINVNLYGTANYVNTAWNNWQTTSSLTSPTFKYSDGSQSTVSSVLTAQTSYADNGPSYAVTMCPQQVGRDASYATATRYDTLRGLNNSKLYDLQLYASRGNAGQTTRYTINGTSVDIATNNNFTNAASFSNITPNNGRIVITIANLATYNYLNGFTLTEKTILNNQPPTSYAGPDQVITLPTSSVSLSGSGTDPDGTIASYAWTQVGGTPAVITSPATAATTVTGLTTTGIWAFRLTVLDDQGATATSDVTITVNSSNQPPVANAGPGQNVILPTSTATLTGSATDPDGTIASYAWTQVGGTAATIVNPSSATTDITGLTTTGTRTFRLTVTDNNGATGASDVIVNVSNPGNQPPTANAGSNQTITQPATSANLSGSGNDPDGTIASYAWSIVSGPNLPTITTATLAATSVTGLIPGTYVFRLTVTDNLGAVGNSDVTVTLNFNITSPSVVTNAPQTITTTTASFTSTASSVFPVITTKWTKFSVPGQAVTSITVVGSSTAAGTGASIPDSAFVNKLKTYYKAQGIIDTIYNLSVGGTWPMDVDITAALNKGAPILLVNYPSNNYSVSNLAASIAKFQEIKDSCDARGVLFYCTGTQPRDNYDAPGRANLVVLNDSLRNRFGNRFIDVLTPLLNTADNTLKPPFAYGDGIHLNDAGHDKLFQLVKATNIFQNLISSGSTITTPTSGNTQVTGLTAGIHQFQVSIVDSRGMAATAVARVTVNPSSNQSPTANAGVNQTITLPNSTVTLNGSGIDPDGSIASYAWTQIGGTAATITSPGAATTTITGLTTSGARIFRLTVTDNQGATGTSDVTITVNQPPVANAGANQLIIFPTATTSLTGSGTDADGTIASYAWTQVGGTTATITSPAAATTNITGMTTSGARVFRLTVTDNLGATGTSDVTVTVNQAPVSNAGANQIITLPLSSTTLNGSGTDPDGTIASYAWTQISGTTATIGSPATASTSITGLTTSGARVFRLTVTDNLGTTGFSNVTINVNQPPVANAGTNQTITLPTSTTTLSGSGTDADGTIASYGWTQISGTAATIGSPSSASTGISGLTTAGARTFRLTVTDNLGATGTSDIIVNVNASNNQSPVANAGSNQVINLPASTAVLTGVGIDIDGTIASYAWTQVGGTAAGIVSPGSATTNITGLTTSGARIFRLTVTDNLGATGTSDVTITVNQPPVANAGTNKTITLPVTTTTFNGSGTDADGTIASYAWTQIGGTSATIASPAAATTNITGLTTTGVRTFRLTVTDNLGATNTSDVTVTVNPANQSPTANAGTNQTITLPATTATLTGSGTDPDGTIASYAWSQVNGTAAGITSPTQSTTGITGLTTTGVRTFRLTVTDNLGATGTSDVTITVNPAQTTQNRVINVNLYGTANYVNTAWNNWQVTSSLSSGLLKYSDGTTSTISSVLSSQTSYADNGPSYPVTMCPQQVGRDASYATVPRGDTLKGLDNSKLYDLQLFASRGNAGQTTRFTINGTNIDIATNANYTNSANFTNITPTNGRIVITLTNLATYNYLNGFVLTEKTAVAGRPGSDPGIPITQTGNDQKDENAAGKIISKPIFRITPNPVRDQFVVEVQNNLEGTFKLQVYDENGTVRKETQFMKEKGFARYSLSSAGLRPGSYFIRISMGDWSDAIRILKL